MVGPHIVSDNFLRLTIKWAFFFLNYNIFYHLTEGSAGPQDKINNGYIPFICFTCESWMIEPLLRLLVKTALILGLLKSLAVKTVCYIVQKTKICPELIILSLTRV